MSLWRDLRTVFSLAARVNALQDDWDEVRIDLADKLDKLDRLLRRLTLRETRDSSASRESPPETVTTTDHKTQLRDAARARGLIR